MNITQNTERLVNDMLPTMLGTTSETVVSTYDSFVAELKDITADNTPLDWDVIHAATDAFHSDSGETRLRIGKLAAETRVGTKAHLCRTRWAEAYDSVRIHGDEGTFVACRADGTIMASGHLENPLVPASYGIADPWPFFKIAEAAAIARISPNSVHDVRENPGYVMLKALKGSDSPHLGHSIEWDAGELTQVCGATGRTISDQFRAFVQDTRPDIVARMVGEERHPDDLAGLADSLSGTVVLRALHLLHQGIEPSALMTTRVNLPVSPESFRDAGVDWN